MEFDSEADEIQKIFYLQTYILKVFFFCYLIKYFGWDFLTFEHIFNKYSAPKIDKIQIFAKRKRRLIFSFENYLRTSKIPNFGSPII